MKRNLTFVNLPSVSQSTFKASRSDLPPSKIFPVQEVDKFKDDKFKNIDAIDIDQKPTKKPSSDTLWRMALENSRKKRNTDLSNSIETPQSSYIYRINRDIGLCPRSNQSMLSWQPNILAITMLSAMFGIVLYFTNNNQENTLDMISHKLKIFG